MGVLENWKQESIDSLLPLFDLEAVPDIELNLENICSKRQIASAVGSELYCHSNYKILEEKNKNLTDFKNSKEKNLKRSFWLYFENHTHHSMLIHLVGEYCGLREDGDTVLTRSTPKTATKGQLAFLLCISYAEKVAKQFYNNTKEDDFKKLIKIPTLNEAVEFIKNKTAYNLRKIPHLNYGS